MIRGVEYVVRTCLHVYQYSERSLEEALACVGTIMHKRYPERYEFPPQEILDLFPAYVGARFVERGSSVVEYESPRPYPRMTDLHLGDVYTSADVWMSGAREAFYRTWDAR